MSTTLLCSEVFTVSDSSSINFGGGLRVYIGIAFAKMEMKIVTAHLLRSYHWEILPNQSLDTVRLPTNLPKDGLRVRFKSW